MYPAGADGDGRQLPALWRDALDLCAGCPVTEPCRAAGEREHEGVWGGTTPEGRGYGKRRTPADT